MAATSQRGATGYLRFAEMRGLLRHANASTQLRPEFLEETLRAVEETRSNRGLFETRAAAGGNLRNRWGAYEITELLLRLCISSKDIEQLFNTYGSDGRMAMTGWLTFHSTEQSASSATVFQGDVAEFASQQRSGGAHSNEESAILKRRFEEAVTLHSDALEVDAGLSVKQFALQLLNHKDNSLLSPGLVTTETDWAEPFAHYWTAASHNSYIVGDQLTGRSTSDAYRRQLLQVLSPRRLPSARVSRPCIRAAILASS